MEEGLPVELWFWSNTADAQDMMLECGRSREGIPWLFSLPTQQSLASAFYWPNTINNLPAKRATAGVNFLRHRAENRWVEREFEVRSKE